MATPAPAPWLQWPDAFVSRLTDAPSGMLRGPTRLRRDVRARDHPRSTRGSRTRRDPRCRPASIGRPTVVRGPDSRSASCRRAKGDRSAGESRRARRPAQGHPARPAEGRRQARVALGDRRATPRSSPPPPAAAGTVRAARCGRARRDDHRPRAAGATPAPRRDGRGSGAMVGNAWRAALVKGAGFPVAFPQTPTAPVQDDPSLPGEPLRTRPVSASPMPASPPIPARPGR